MADPIMHRKVLSDGTLTEVRKELDPDLVLSRADAVALGKSYWLPEVYELQDTSTDVTIRIVDASSHDWQLDIPGGRVHKLDVYRDMTAQEIEDRRLSRRQAIRDYVTEDKATLVLLRMIQDLATNNAPVNPDTNAKMLAWIETHIQD